MTKKRKTLHFKSKSGFRRWTAYGHMHGAMGHKRKGFPTVKIRGKTHRVKH